MHIDPANGIDAIGVGCPKIPALLRTALGFQPFNSVERRQVP
jgi:hypothetical protein